MFQQVVDALNRGGEWGAFQPVIMYTAPGETEIGVGIRDNKIYIGFQGTNVREAVDLWANLDARLISSDVVGGRVHQGFYNKLFGSEDGFSFLVLLVDFLYAWHSEGGYDGIVVTGHSQGAALATLFGVYYADLYPERQLQVFNIGSPRVGDEEFKVGVRVNLPNLTIFRMVFEEDWVARLPNRWMSYRHVGHLITLQGSGQAKAYFQQTGDSSLSYAGVPDSEWDVNYLDFTDLTDPFDDHADAEYLASLELAVANPGMWPTGFERELERYCCRRFIFCIRYCYRPA